MNLSNYKNDYKEDLEFKEEQQKNIIKCKYSKVCAISFYSLCMSRSSAYIHIYILSPLEKQQMFPTMEPSSRLISFHE